MLSFSFPTGTIARPAYVARLTASQILRHDLNRLISMKIAAIPVTRRG
jgi:hypothetical protein